MSINLKSIGCAIEFRSLQGAFGSIAAGSLGYARAMGHQMIQGKPRSENAVQTVPRLDKQAPPAWVLIAVQGHGPRGKGTLLPREFVR